MTQSFHSEREIVISRPARARGCALLGLVYAQGQHRRGATEVGAIPHKATPCLALSIISAIRTRSAQRVDSQVFCTMGTGVQGALGFFSLA